MSLARHRRCRVVLGSPPQVNRSMGEHQNDSLLFRSRGISRINQNHTCDQSSNGEQDTSRVDQINTFVDAGIEPSR